MSNLPPPAAKPRIPLALVGAGVLVVALGFALPLLTPGTTPAPAPVASEPSARPAAPTPIAPPSAPNLFASLLKLVAGLAVMCGLCVAVAKWAGPKAPPTPGAMDVAASIAVGPCVLHLVRAGDRRLLIGTDMGGVKAVLELPGTAPEPEVAPEPPAAETAAEPAPEPEADPLTQQKLLSLLLQLRAQKGAPSPP